MIPFTSKRARDACFAIRGFVYQVDATVAQWLRLGDNEAIDLECGEDIDHVSTALGSEADRLLEQIKVRSKISLQRAEALEAVANAAEHDSANPALKLRFKFTTTAQIAREKKSPFPNLPPGIELWEALRKGTRDPSVLQHFLKAVHAIVGASRRPAAVPKGTWEATKPLLSNPDKLLAIVHRFEWATAAVSPDEQKPQIISTIISTNLSSTQERATELYEQLFFFVFRLLTQKGLKRLTRDILIDQAKRPAMSEQDRAALNRIVTNINWLKLRIGALEKRVDAINERVDDIDSKVTKSFGLPFAAVALGAPELDINPPPIAQVQASRTHRVKQLSKTNSSWLALVGEAGIGKSHLATLVVRALDRQAVWIQLAATTPTEASTRVMRVLSAWAKCTSLDSRQILKQAASCVRSVKATIVLDSMPKLTRHDKFGELITHLSNLVEDWPLAVITTGTHAIPPAIRHASGQSCQEVSRLAFTKEEAAEFFIARGGAAFVETYPQALRMLTAHTGGHATLLSAMAVFLDHENWQWNERIAAKVRSKEYARSTHSETREMLRATVSSGDTRELLERLLVGSASFTASDVHALAQVSPPIGRPMEHLEELLGIWLRPQGDNMWRLTSLLSVLPAAGLAPDVERRCHIALAQILSDGPLSSAACVRAFTHWFSAGETDKAGITLAMALETLSDAELGAELNPALKIAWTAKLPRSMAVGVRLFIRYSQLRTARKRGTDHAFVKSDLESLLSISTAEDAWAVALGETRRFVETFDQDPIDATKSFKRAQNAAPLARLPDGSRCPMPDLAPAVWAVAHNLPSRSHLEAWLTLVSLLPNSSRSWKDEQISARESCQLACTKIYLREYCKPSDQAHWEEAHEELDLIINAARRSKFDYLEACAVRSKVIALCENNNLFVEGIRIAQEALARTGSDSHCRFLLNESIGRQHYIAGEHAQALVYLQKAIDDGAGLDPRLACLAANYAVRAANIAEPASAISFAEQAIAVARAAPHGDTTPESILQSCGELALIQWHAGDVKNCAQTILHIADEFEDKLKEEDFRESVGVAFVQATIRIGGALLNLSANRPDQTYPFPQSGFFYDQPWREGLEWKASFATLLAMNLCPIAEVAGSETKAQYWARRSLDLGLAEEHELSPELLAPSLAYLFLSERDSATALDAVDRAIFIVRATRKARSFDQNPSFERRSGQLVWHALMPLAFSLASSAIENRHSASTIAKDVVQKIRPLELGSPDTSIWKDFMLVLPAPYTGATYQEIFQRYIIPLDADNQGLRTIFLLQATMCEDAPVTNAVDIHAQILSALCRDGILGPTKTIIERFVARYWRAAFYRSRFVFRNPREVERSINELSARSASVRARQTLAVVAEGLDVKLFPIIQAWLQTD